jgi:hypothetical protein
MDQSLDEWSAEYDRLSAALEPYRQRIMSKLGRPDGPQELAEPEHVFERLDYYWSAALVNNGDVFGYLPFIIENKAAFIALGAGGTLRAVDQLMPFYVQQQELKDDVEKGQYWWRTKDERAPAEASAEGVHEFARLLLAYAERNLPTPSSVELEESRRQRAAALEHFLSWLEASEAYLDANPPRTEGQEGGHSA